MEVKMRNWLDRSRTRVKIKWERTKLVFRSAKTSKTIQWIGSGGIVIMFASLGSAGYVALCRPRGILLDISAGYLLGFLFGALLHDLACAAKRDGSELLRYIRLSRGKKYAWLAWALAGSSFGAAVLLAWLQATVTVSVTTLVAAMLASLIASEFSMMYINALQDFRETLSDSECEQPDVE